MIDFSVFGGGHCPLLALALDVFVELEKIPILFSFMMPLLTSFVESSYFF